MDEINYSFLPTAIVGWILYGFIKTHLLSNTVVVLWSLFLGGVFLIVWEKYFHVQKNIGIEIEDLSYKKADRHMNSNGASRSFLIGIFQSLSVVPGVSRAAATIVGGMISGLHRRAAVEFSFLLAVPTMCGAAGLDLVKSDFSFSISEWGILGLGFTVAFCSALVAVRFLLRFIEHNTLVHFGIYRIVLAIFFWWLLYSFR